MSETQQDFAAAHYGPRAQSYVTSAVHASGPDLDRIEALLSGAANAVVLDLGCGGGHVSYRASPYARRVVACDPTPAMLAAVRETAAAKGLSNIETVETAAEKLPFDNAHFDYVLCRFTAHHWADLGAGLREAFRVLKAGGRAVFIDSIAPENAVLDTHLQSIEILRDVSHVRNYRVSEWRAALGQAGFLVENKTLRRVPIMFSDWTARTRTPEHMIAALHALMQNAPASVRAHLAINEACDFELEAMMIEAAKP